MILMGDERQDWLDQCLESLANEPITLHICDGIVGDIRGARSRAIRKGSNEWIGWVDPDDFIIPGAYSRLLDIVGDKKFAWSKEEIWDLTPDGNVLLKKRQWYAPHHMHIVHRSILDYEMIESKAPIRRPDSWVEHLRNKGVFDDNVGYVWRRFDNSGSKRLFRSYDKKFYENMNK
jgi:hypothetical protein